MATVDIMDVARECGLDILERTAGLVEVQANCPFCNDRHHHLYLNTLQNKWMCQRCRVGGKTAVSLYAQHENISNEDAFSLITGNPSISVSVKNKPERIIKQFELKPLPYRHAVYLHFLNLLQLSSFHRADLRRRGLSDEIIKGNLYKTVPLDYAVRYKIIKELLKHYDLSGIPGFYYNEKNRDWCMAARAGFFIPICDHENQIQGLQIRLDDESNKRYRWFSTSKYENGCGAKGWIHVAGDTESDTVCLTEGGLKADVASFLTNGGLYVAVPGANALGYLPDTLKALCAKHILDCMDMDKLTNEYVYRGVNKIAQIAKRHCSSYSSYRWDSDFKGIDDFLLYKQKNEYQADA